MRAPFHAMERLAGGGGDTLAAGAVSDVRAAVRVSKGGRDAVRWDFAAGDLVEVRVPVVFMGECGTPGEPADISAAFGGPLVWASGVVQERRHARHSIVVVLDLTVTRLRVVCVGWESLRWPVVVAR